MFLYLYIDVLCVVEECVVLDVDVVVVRMY